MRGFLFVLSALGVMGLAFWAYHENYATQGALGQVRDLHAQIGDAHSRLRMLNAEWAYLNRPDRLRDLADLNFDRLGLLPMLPDAFGRVDQVAFPPAPLSQIIDPVDISFEAAPNGEEPL